MTDQDCCYRGCDNCEIWNPELKKEKANDVEL